MIIMQSWSVVRYLSLMPCLLFAVTMSAASAEEILSCEIAGDTGAYFRLTENQGQVSYVFGKEGDASPSTAVSMPIGKVVYRSWDNYGQYLSYLVVLRKDDHVYSVYASYDNWSGVDATGVTVEHKEVFLADHRCRHMTVKGDLVAYVRKKMPK